MSIHMKKYPGPAAQGNYIRISYTTGGAPVWPALSAFTDQNGNHPSSYIIDRIESVTNFGSTDVTALGYTFSPGSWEMDELGGLAIDTPITDANAGQAMPGGANCLITVRGQVSWAGVTTHTLSQI